MNKDDLFKKYNLNSSVKNLIEELENATGKTFKFIEKSDLSVRATIKIARKGMDNHLIYLKTLKTPLLNHLIAHELGHLIRMIKVPESERLVPAVTEKNISVFREAVESDFQKEKYSIKKEIVQNLMVIWHNGIIRQLTNLPVDYRIEFWIYKYLPEIRKEQKTSVEEDLKIAISGLSKEVRAFTPGTIFVASLAMSYAFTKGMDLLLGTNYLEHYSDILIKQKGESLYQFLASEDLGYLQDIEIINSWAEVLGIRDWFTWVPFNAIPNNYENETL
jgi:hypothetical protein